MTLTFRVLDAARHRLWLVTGAIGGALRKLWVGRRIGTCRPSRARIGVRIHDSARQANCQRRSVLPTDAAGRCRVPRQ